MSSRVGGVSVLVSLVSLLLLMPTVALGQDSSIVGEVSDETGGVLPGVTVEVSSPALIEGSRVAATDGQGRYAVISLRPGIYSIQFTLPGFSTVVRDEVELTAGFTATVDVQLTVGALDETIIVSGRAPAVDLTQVRGQSVVTKDELDTLPTSKEVAAIAVLSVGVDSSSQDVGGVREGTLQYLSAHGGDVRDGMRQMDGMTMGNLSCGYSCTNLQESDAQTEELSFEYGAISAEVAVGGVRVNVIPKSGGNTFSGSMFANFSNDSLQGDNLPQELADRGFPRPDVLESIYDQHLDLGGPIVRDKLWFHASYRHWGQKVAPLGAFFDSDPDPFNYVPGDEPALDSILNHGAGARLTYQANPTNKFSVFYYSQPRLLPALNVSRTRTPQAAFALRSPKNSFTTATWTGSVSNRLLLEAGFGLQVQDVLIEPRPGQEGFSLFTEATTGVSFGSSGFSRRWEEPNRSYRASLSYVTGSHEFKVGMNMNEGTWTQTNTAAGPSDSFNVLLFGRPFLILPLSTPYHVSVNLDRDLGFYVQDTWTLRNTTLNLGLRWDHVKESVPPQDTGAPGTWVPRRVFEGVPDAANLNDLSPRFSVSHDLFGDGTTAIKASVSKYLRVETIQVGATQNPVFTVAFVDQRFWNDLNGDFFPDENELGPFQNENFGTANVTTFLDEDVHSGFGNRRNNWEYSVGIEREILPQTSVSFSYWRRTNHNFTITDNELVEPSDFDEFCVTAPTDPRLPGGVSGSHICGLYDLNPDKVGQVRNQIKLAEAAGYLMQQTYDGIDLVVTSRVSGDLFFSGGFATGRSKFNDCEARADSPSVSPRSFIGGDFGLGDSPGGWDFSDSNTGTELPIGRHCVSDPPFWRPAVKLSGAYTLPYDIQVSAAMQFLPGVPRRAEWTISDANVEGLGRPLTGEQVVQLTAPGTLYGDRINQVDLRLSKLFGFGGSQRLRVMVDFYNLLNASAQLRFDPTYGRDWDVPASIMLARFVKFGAQFTF